MVGRAQRTAGVYGYDSPPFNSKQADFFGLCTSAAGNIFISRVIHKPYISVAEGGTRDGAATLVEACDEAVIENPKQVYLDRPFVYMLNDCHAGIPFFKKRNNNCRK